MDLIPSIKSAMRLRMPKSVAVGKDGWHGDTGDVVASRALLVSTTHAQLTQRWRSINSKTFFGPKLLVVVNVFIVVLVTV